MLGSRQGVSKLRNRVLGRVFRELGLIEQWGSGIQRMFRACREAGLTEPHIEEIGSHFRVTLYRGHESAPTRDELDVKILACLREQGDLSTKQIADLIERSPRATRNRMVRLVERGLVVEIGTGPQDPRKRYALVTDR